MLGPHLLICRDRNAWRGHVAEFSALVHPRDFDATLFPEQEQPYLARYMPDGAYTYYGPDGDQALDTTPARADPSPPELLDRNPRDSNGFIYDIDAPGLPVFRTAPGTASPLPVACILRLRVNLRAYAVQGGLRCSEYTYWHSIMSMRKTGPEDFGTATRGAERELWDTTKNWPQASWLFVMITSGTGAGQLRRIVANGPNWIRIAQPWVPNEIPDATSRYWLVSEGTWTSVDDVIGDNITGDGQLDKLTWDLN
jgi:hypothetical protein